MIGGKIISKNTNQKLVSTGTADLWFFDLSQKLWALGRNLAANQPNSINTPVI